MKKLPPPLTDQQVIEQCVAIHRPEVLMLFGLGDMAGQLCEIKRRAQAAGGRIDVLVWRDGTNALFWSNDPNQPRSPSEVIEAYRKARRVRELEVEVEPCS